MAAKRYSRQINLRVEPEQWSAVSLAAEAMGRGVNEYVRIALERQLKKDGIKVDREGRPCPFSLG